MTRLLMNDYRLEGQRIQRLYKLMEKLEEQGRDEEVHLLEWAIFELERKFDIKVGDIPLDD